MATANASPNTTSDQIDPHLAWAARAKKLQAERELLRDDAARDAKTDELGELWGLIGSTKARTLAGARVQVQCVAEQLIRSPSSVSWRCHARPLGGSRRRASEPRRPMATAAPRLAGTGA